MKADRGTAFIRVGSTICKGRSAPKKRFEANTDRSLGCMRIPDTRSPNNASSLGREVVLSWSYYAPVVHWDAERARATQCYRVTITPMDRQVCEIQWRYLHTWNSSRHAFKFSTLPRHDHPWNVFTISTEVSSWMLCGLIIGRIHGPILLRHEDFGNV